MDIREATEEQKAYQINRIKEFFGDIRSMIDTLEIDMVSKELMVQATSVWIGSQLCHWYSDFRKQIAELDQKMSTLNQLKNEIKETVDVNSNATDSDSSVY